MIKIGEINSYKAQPAFLEPYRKGLELAAEEVNGTGGINDKKLQLITRDDNKNPGDAVRMAEELVSRERVDVLTGDFLSKVGLAMTDFSKQRKFFYLASAEAAANGRADRGNGAEGAQRTNGTYQEIGGRAQYGGAFYRA